MRRGTWLAWGTAALAATLAFAGPEEPSGPVVGSAAPDFRLNDQAGKAVRFSEARGEGWAILAFFPKAATPG
jgi:peroxiredoxin Q/BCP